MKKQIMIPGVTLAILALITLVYIVPNYSSAQAIEIDMYEFGYTVKDGSQPLHIIAGKEYTFYIRNIGGVEHEFMIVKDPERVNSDLKNLVKSYLDMGMTFEEIYEALEGEHHELEEAWSEENIFIDVLRLGPGESDSFTVKIDSPGTYYVVCLVLKGSAPDTHLDRGMIMELNVTS